MVSRKAAFEARLHHPHIPTAGPPYRFTRNEEAEAADAAGAEALASKLGDTDVPASAVQMPASPFSQASEQQPQHQQQQHVAANQTQSVCGERSGCMEDGNLGESLLNGGGDITGTEAATAREAAMIMEFERSSSFSGPTETASFKSKADKELPPLCAPSSDIVWHSPLIGSSQQCVHWDAGL